MITAIFTTKIWSPFVGKKIMYLHEIKFDSTEPTYVKDLTEAVNGLIKKTKTKQGFVMVSSRNTTLGIILNEIAVPNLIQDIINHSLESVREDKRSVRAGKSYSHPTTDYRHRCQDNPFCNEIDEDYNAAAHIRALTFAHPSVTIPIRDGKMELGKYQQVAMFEFDGRDGKGKNPVRKRTIQIWISPSENLEII
jgi:thiamine phosphate synthase YjbQ (UPF0047 family)